MVYGELDELQRIYQLRRIAEGKAKLDVSSLESTFSSFSRYLKERSLKVMLPKLYALKGEEVSKMESAIKALGISVAKVPDAVGFAGGFDYLACQDALIVLSPEQYRADRFSFGNCSLDPLVYQVYVQGNGLLASFSIHEPLVCHVKCRRGDLHVPEIPLFPDEFRPGPFTLSARLDTPNESVAKFLSLMGQLKQLEEAPSQILDKSKLESIVKLAAGLRERLGALSRYDLPQSQNFEVETNYYVLRNKNNSLFYAYLQDKNVLVYFGQNPFHGDAPANLAVIDGSTHSEALAKLVDLGMYSVSANVLDERIAGLKQFYKDATRQANTPLNGHYPRFKELVEQLEKVRERLGFDARTAKEFALSQPKELLEFMVCPAVDDPMVYELLPLLSWNKVIREYYDTPSFMARFSAADEAARKEMLGSVVPNILFSDHQNNDVNVWLYKNHKDFCESVGVHFDLAAKSS